MEEGERMRAWIQTAALVAMLTLVGWLGGVGTASAQTKAADPQTRWITGDEVRIRAAASADAEVIGAAWRGAEVKLRNAVEKDGFCAVGVERNEGVSEGYIACRFLSATPITSSRAGADGIDVAQRWVNGNGVIVRDAPNIQGNVVTRLSMNGAVKLLSNAPSAGYCEIQFANVGKGYTACLYLKAEVPVLLRMRLALALRGGADLEKDFWLKPSWRALESYATDLHQNLPPSAKAGPWAKDDALEKMKAHLALGLRADQPNELLDWSEVKRIAASSAEQDLTSLSKDVPQDLKNKESVLTARETVRHIAKRLGLHHLAEHSAGRRGGGNQILGLIGALNVPPASQSYFSGLSEIAPPNASTEEASGRFGIVFRTLVTRRKVDEIHDVERRMGVYDMKSYSQALVSPVSFVRLFRDGALRLQPSHVRKERFLFGDVDETGGDCIDGFGYGAAEVSVWRYFGDDKIAAEMRKTNPNPDGSLFAFYTRRPLPRMRAEASVWAVDFDRGQTGFIRGEYRSFDLDHDGIPDIIVWEGQGKGPGHLEGPTKTDDKWYRLVLVNINGAWKVLGSDSFGYGCGC